MQSDFDRWIDYHGKAYPGFAKWIADNDAQVRFLRRLLEQYTIDQLSSATDRMYALEDQPRGYGEHGRKIRQLVVEAGGASQQSNERHGPELRDGRLVANCWRCMDYGLVSVLSPSTLRRIRSNDQSHCLATCSVACDCQRGQQMSRRIQRLPQWADGHCLIRYEDVIDEAEASHRDTWDVACDMVADRDQRLVPRAVELSAEALP